MASIVIGDYTYNTNGRVEAVDKTKQSYGSILSSFEYDGQTYNVTNMSQCFYKCVNLINAPIIPEGIINMSDCFAYCTSLIETPSIPTSVEDLTRCFLRCTSLIRAEDFPLTTTPVLKDMSGCFAYCTSLTKAPKQIPKSVTTLVGCFVDCKSLERSTQSIYSIVSSGTDSLNMAGCFAGCESLKTSPGLPDKVTDLKTCFQGCISLTNVSSLPKNVKDVSGCFNGCQSLQGNIEVENVPENSANIFANIYNQNIYIINKASSEIKEDVAEEWKSIANQYSSVHYEADDHGAPTIALSAKRSNDDGESSSTGRYITVTKQYNYNLDNLPVGWGIDITESMKLDGGSITPTSSEPGESITFTIPQEIDELSHTIVYTVYDGYKTTVQTVEISKVIALLDFFGNPSNKVYPNDKSGMGMAIGKMATRNGLDIKFPTTIGEGLVPVTRFKYDAVENPTGNPFEQGWYEEASEEVYILTEDTTVISGKTYYEQIEGSEYVDLENYQLIVGKYNKQNNNATFIVGNGTEEEPSNIMEVGDEIVLGRSDGTQSFVRMDYHSIQMFDKENAARSDGIPYFWISDLRNKDGIYHIEYIVVFRSSYPGGPKIGLDVTAIINDNYIVTVNGVEWTNVEKTRTYIQFPLNDLPPDGSEVKISYDSSSNSMKAYTLGTRQKNSFVAPFSYAEGFYTNASGIYSHAEGRRSTASEYCSHAEGDYTTASDTCSHAEGGGSTASGYYSHAEGYYATASGGNSHAEGHSSTASGYCSHAEGHFSTASGEYSHAEGSYTTASGWNSHAEGDETTASGDYSHAEGHSSTASGYCSHAQNWFTIAAKDYQTVIGRYNIEDKETSEYTQKAFIIGNGEDENERSNAFEVNWNGDTKAYGEIKDGRGNILSNKVNASSLGGLATKNSVANGFSAPTGTAKLPAFTTSTFALQQNVVVTSPGANYVPIAIIACNVTGSGSGNIVLKGFDLDGVALGSDATVKTHWTNIAKTNVAANTYTVTVQVLFAKYSLS